MQRVLRKFECHLEEKEYKKFHAAGSKAGLFYGTAKLHKLKKCEELKKLTVRPIISNIETVTYETTKYLNILLTPLAKSEHTILNADDFIEKIQRAIIPEGCKMISLDVKNVFINVPPDQTIEIILSKVYQEKEIGTSISKTILRELLYLCTKEVHFMFNDQVYIQNDGAAMGSPLEPLFVNIFMSSLEQEVIPPLTSCLCNWKRYNDDTHAYANYEKFDTVLIKLNFFHPNFQFTFE